MAASTRRLDADASMSGLTLVLSFVPLTSLRRRSPRSVRTRTWGRGQFLFTPVAAKADGLTRERARKKMRLLRRPKRPREGGGRGRKEEASAE